MTLRGKVDMVRYADDLCIRCDRKEDAEKIVKALKGRLNRFSLELNEDKTKLVSFSHRDAHRGVKQETFDFLGYKDCCVPKSNKMLF